MSASNICLCRYHYDAIDQLTGLVSAGQPMLHRFYRHEHLVTELQGHSSQSVLQQGNQLLALNSREGDDFKSRLLATDLQRSVLHVTDPVAPVQQVYTAYGHRRAEGGLASLLGFNGEAIDPVTGHYLLGNGRRAFNPVLMRFNSPDRLSPFGRGGLNPYAYCLGDPVNFSDPTGQFAAIARILTSFGGLFNSAITLRPGIPFQLGLDALENGVVFRSPLRHTLGAVSAVSAGVTSVLAGVAGLASTIIAAVNPASSVLVPLANTSLGLVGSSVVGRIGSWWAARDAAVMPALRNLSNGSPAVASRVISAGTSRPLDIAIDMTPRPSGFSPSAPLPTPGFTPSAPPQSPLSFPFDSPVSLFSSAQKKRGRYDRPTLKARRIRENENSV